MKILLAAFKSWLPLAVSFTLLFGFLYIAVQQTYRTAADDPQVQMAEDAAALLAGGMQASQLVPILQVDMASSLSPFMIVYDSTGKPVAANVTLNGRLPVLPSGVLDYTRQNGQDRITWQPQREARSAAVIVAVDGGEGGFVLAGRSLREVELRQSRLRSTLGLGWLVTLIAAAFVIGLLELIPSIRNA